MQTKKVKFTISTNGESSNVSEIIEVVVDNQFTESEMIDAINDKYIRWVHSMNIGGWSFINERKLNISLENWLRNKLQESEEYLNYCIATDTIRCWIDEYNLLTNKNKTK